MRIMMSQVNEAVVLATIMYKYHLAAARSATICEVTPGI